MVTHKEELALKVKLEQRLKPKIKKLLRQIGNDAVIVWRATGNTPNLINYHQELVSTLRDHYRVVNKYFRPIMIDKVKYSELNLELKQVFENAETDNENESQLNIALLLIAALYKADNTFVEYVNRKSEEQATYILNTTQHDLNGIMDRQTLAVAIENVSKEEAARRARRDFFGTINDRVDTIALTETQVPAEKSKLIYALVLAALIANVTDTPTTPVKTWRTVIDSATRPSHIAANGQVRSVNEPFLVGGQLLPAPGDTSLGATAGNIINCRCSTEYALEQV